jgi:chitin synthase
MQCEVNWINLLCYCIFNLQRGEAGSGKSEVQKLLFRNFCDLSRTTPKKTKVHSALLRLSSILSAFGHATTPFNSDSSCFTQYTEVQFNGSGKMMGFKLIDYLLEKERVTGPSDGGKSFHIFYYLLEGATDEERFKWHLSDTAHFAYLSKSSMVGFAQGKGPAPLDNIRKDLKAMGIGRRSQEQLWQILSVILHLGNVQFADSPTGRETCSVKNFPQLQMVAEMLGVNPQALQNTLISRTKMIGRDNISTFLDAADAEKQRDYFTRCLYSVCFSWIIEQINQKMCAPDATWQNFVSLLNIPGLSGFGSSNNGFHTLLNNYINERVYSHTMNEIFVTPREAFVVQQIEFPTAVIPSNREILGVMSGTDGILQIVDNEAVKLKSKVDIAPLIYNKHLSTGVIVSASSKKFNHSFGVHHYGGIVQYNTSDFIEIDGDILQSDFVALVRGDPQSPGTTNSFLRSLFSDKLIATKKGSDSVTVIAAASLRRTPSMRRRKTEDDESNLDTSATIGHILRNDLNSLLDNMSNSQPWFIFNLKAFEGDRGRISDQVLKRQIDAFEFASMVNLPSLMYTSCYSFDDFSERYKQIVSMWTRDSKSAVESLIKSRNWNVKDAVMGTTSIFLGEPLWLDLELKLKSKEDELQPQKAIREAQTSGQRQSSVDGSFTSDAFQAANYAESVDGSEFSDDTGSHYDSEFEFPQARGGKGVEDVEMGRISKSKLAASAPTTALKKSIPPPEPKKVTPLRRKWLCFVWSSTWCFFPFCLSFCGRMRPKERQLAWREKFALCIIIFFMNASVLFAIIGTGYLICPKNPQHPEQSPGEISGRFENGPSAAVYMYGNYYLVDPILKKHLANYMEQTAQNPDYFKINVNGKDVTYMFPRQANPDGRDRSGKPYCVLPVPSTFQLRNYKENDSKWYPHRLASITEVERYWKGPVVVEKKFLNDQILKGNGEARFIIIYDKVYDLTPFYSKSLNPVQVDGQFFLGKYFTDTANFYSSGQELVDASSAMIALRKQDQRQHDNVMQCLNSLFLIGKVDHRNDIECLISNYILLGASVILVMVIGFKFIAALQFPGKKEPEDHEKFVICQVPCYTEVFIYFTIGRNVVAQNN